MTVCIDSHEFVPAVRAPDGVKTGHRGLHILSLGSLIERKRTFTLGIHNIDSSTFFLRIPKLRERTHSGAGRTGIQPAQIPRCLFDERDEGSVDRKIVLEVVERTGEYDYVA